MRLCELRNKEVINCCDCTIIGTVYDIEFDLKCGVIESLIVPGPPRLFGLLGRDIEYIIPYQCVKNIGPDAILVEVLLDKVSHKCG